jgi:hypothetical protein
MPSYMDYSKLERLLRFPLYFDPIPPWIKLSDDQMNKYKEIDTRLNAKAAQIRTELINETAKISRQKLEEFEKITNYKVPHADPIPPWIIHWDPAPPWIKLTEEQANKFKHLEVQLDEKMNKLYEMKINEIKAIETQLKQELSKALGTPI